MISQNNSLNIILMISAFLCSYTLFNCTINLKSFAIMSLISDQSIIKCAHNYQKESSKRIK